MGIPSSIAPHEFHLDDRYRVERGGVLLSGIQALARVLLDRHRADARAGLRTGTFVSGYPGSPLAGFDLVLGRERVLMAEHDVHLVPGVNEELAATAVWGSQQDGLGALDGRDGVVAVWFGKAPGVDRCGDVFRHGNLMGVSPTGGVLVLAGDDPVSKSSTIPSASEIALSDAQMPVLYPGNPQEILDLGMHAIALSRQSGLWVSMKLVTNVADGFGTAEVGPDRVIPVVAPVDVDGTPWHYAQGGLALPPRNLSDERDLVSGRLEAARAYARANSLNEVTATGGDRPRVGIVAGGKTYHDVVQALREIGLGGDDVLEQAGVRLLRLGMIWPLEPEVVRAFARGLEEIVVVEEKRSFVELQVRDALYDLDTRPRVVGKRDEHGHRLFPADGELTPERVAPLLASRLPVGVAAGSPRERITVSVATEPAAPSPGSGPRVSRAPYFCSGCPHNRSTLVPDGSVAGGGIGCHTMAALTGRSAVAVTQMGGEGAEWIGRAPFTDRRHMFQNLGDGTLFHSGSMAIRACVSAGVNITYKILYNGTVAMTGGQDASGGVPVPELTRILEAEGVVRTIVCAEEPSSYPDDARWGRNVDVWPRDRLDEAQQLLRDVVGVTVIIYDQGCAAEKRRAAQAREAGDTGAARLHQRAGVRGLRRLWREEQLPVGAALRDRVRPQDPHPPVVVQPGLHVPRRRLPVVHHRHPDAPRATRRARTARAAAAGAPVAPVGREIPAIDDATLPEPDERSVVRGTSNLYLTGVGGTGVVTISQLLATAGLLDGFHVAGLDQTGLSQKGGPVVSHVKLSDEPVDEANTIGAAEADAYLGFDLLVAAEPRNLVQVGRGTRAVVSTSKVPTGSMVADAGLSFPIVDGLLEAVAARTGGAGDLHLDSLALAEGLFGDHMMANLLLLGAAYQAGVVPLSAASIERSVELNGVAVERNRQAFRWGRRYVIDPAGVLAAAGRPDVNPPIEPGSVPVTLRSTRGAPAAGAAPTGGAAKVLTGCELDGPVRAVVERRVPELVDYQHARLARSYLDTVTRVATVEQTAVPGSTALAEAVARNLFKLMAYKDEYEVARLSLRPGLRDELREQFPDGVKVRYRLQPPILRSLGMKKKVSLGPWFRPVFGALRAMRRVRGTPFDPFGHTSVRRTERALVDEYRGLVDKALADLSPATIDRAVALAELPDVIRGYEGVKLANVDAFHEQVRALGY